VKVLSERSRNGVLVMGQVLAGATFASPGGVQLCIGRVPRSAMLTIVDGDLEGVVDALLNSEDIEMASLLIERPNGVKYSLRSRGRVDVAALARQLDPTGGGHPRASGASFNGSLAAAEQHLVETLTRVYSS
jgi:DHHA1 domain